VTVEVGDVVEIVASVVATVSVVVGDAAVVVVAVEENAEETGKVDVAARTRPRSGYLRPSSAVL
jgi:hypothetical protein